MAETKVRPCVCNHAGQDKIYGKGKRLCNVTLHGCRCTVCGKEMREGK